MRPGVDPLNHSLALLSTSANPTRHIDITVQSFFNHQATDGIACVVSISRAIVEGVRISGVLAWE